MAVPNTPNADLEQALFRANLKEKRLRRRAIIAAFVPIFAGLVWLLYSFFELAKWQTRADEIATQEAATEQREKDSQQRVAEAEAKLAASDASAQDIQQREKSATERADDMRQRLVKVRDEIGGLGALLTDLNSARAKASKLMASEAVESQLSDIRSALGRSLGRVEAEIDKALPPEEQKARIYLFVSDDSQLAMAKALAPVLEGAGFDVAATAKNPSHRAENNEIRYFRDPQDKADAARIQELVAKQTGQTDCKIARTSDPDNASGSRKFQVWFGKPAAVAR
jgi:hypothetical protein